MALESTTNIAGLISTNPTISDPISQGDDHIILIKSVLKTTFPGVGGSGFAIPLTATEAELNFVHGVTSAIQTQLNAIPVSLGNQQYTAFITGGTTSAFTLTPSPALVALATNQRYRVKFNATGAVAPTLTVSGLAAALIKQYNSVGAKIPAVVIAGQLSDVEYDGVDWVILDPIPTIPAGTLLGIQTLTSTGTYTPTTGTNSIVVEIVGGGGGGGGLPLTGVSQAGAASGGSSGSYAKGRFTTAFSGVTVTIGAAGSGTSGSGGTIGGTTSFGALMTAPGGSQGRIGTVTTNSTTFISQPSLATASPTGGNICMYAGAEGGYGINVGFVGAGFPSASSTLSGCGGSNPLGSGGNSDTSGSLVGSGYGSGGAGSVSAASTAASAGAAGRPGVCIIHEYS
jgi:hypothetical protein